MLSFVRSYRESNFRLYKESLSSLIPYFFALDHTNYARWLPIHLRDMLALQTKHPEVYEEFEKGNFTVRKSENKFSNIAIDQAHEQNNAIVKGDGGAIGLTEDPAALRRWMVAGPEMSRLIGEFNGTIQEKKQKHHEENLATQKKFHSRVNRLQCILEEMGNPFEEESQDLYSIDNKDVVESEVAHDILKIAEMGGEQYRAFLSKMRDSSGFYEPIKKNKCRLFKPKPKTEAAKSK